jgi:DNA-binding transcriptional LysR family regulator
MSRSDLFSGMSEFLAVAQHASFRAAAAELGVTPSAVSQAVRALEERVGLPLLQRTTRTVALTEAGERLLGQLGPAATTIREALDALGALRSRPLGILRLSAPRIALDLVLYRMLPEFRRLCPDVGVDIDVNDASVDLAAMQCDAGIRIGEYIDRDMVAVRLTAAFRWVVAGAPGYFAVRGRPASPRDLTGHECVRYRFPTARSVYRWEFVRRGKPFSLDPPGSLTTNDHLSMLGLAERGLGLVYTADLVAAAALAAGALQEVLRPWLPVTPGLFLYFPRRNQTQPKLRAFIDVARQVMRTP